MDQHYNLGFARKPAIVTSVSCIFLTSLPGQLVEDEVKGIKSQHLQLSNYQVSGFLCVTALYRLSDSPT